MPPQPSDPSDEIFSVISSFQNLEFDEQPSAEEIDGSFTEEQFWFYVGLFQIPNAFSIARRNAVRTGCKKCVTIMDAVAAEWEAWVASAGGKVDRKAGVEFAMARIEAVRAADASRVRDAQQEEQTKGDEDLEL